MNIISQFYDSNFLQRLPFVVITILIAFSVHEFAHAYTAYKFGDDTAKKQGRLTLNPAAHLDVFGTLFIIIAGFGWARPVPVNRHRFKNPKLAGVLVSLMGPISNLVLAFIGAMLYFVLILSGSFSSIPSFFQEFLNVFTSINVLLFVFNLLPLPPLDGYRIVEDLVSPSIRAKMVQYEQYGVILFLVIVITPLYQYTISPLLNFTTSLLWQWFANIFSLFTM